MPGTMNLNAKLVAAATIMAVAVIATALSPAASNGVWKTPDRLEQSNANAVGQATVIRNVAPNVTLVIRAAEDVRV